MHHCNNKVLVTVPFYIILLVCYILTILLGDKKNMLKPVNCTTHNFLMNVLYMSVIKIIRWNVCVLHCIIMLYKDLKLLLYVCYQQT